MFAKSIQLGVERTLRWIETSSGSRPSTDPPVFETTGSPSDLAEAGDQALKGNRLKRHRCCSPPRYTSITHAFFTNLHKMAKLLVLASCTSALLQQPARRISLTPRMGVVKPCVEINQ